MALSLRSLSVRIASNVSRLRTGGVPEVGFSKPSFCKPSFCKRSVVVASQLRQLRHVASAYGQPPPKEMLTAAFQKTRRAARTTRSTRMSWQLARTLWPVQKRVRIDSVNRFGVSESKMASRKLSAENPTEPGSWFALSDVVSAVLRDVRIAQAMEVERPVRTKLN